MRYFSLAMLFWAVALVIGQAAITPDQQKKVTATAGLLNKMDALVKAGKYDEVLKELPAIQAAVTELATIPELALPVANVIKRIDAVRGDLELQGLTLPEFVKPEMAKPVAKPIPMPMPMPAPGTPAGTPPAGAPAAGEISFVKHVAPFLIAKCGKCHVDGQKGGLNFASYEVLEKGFKGKLAIQKGDSKNSEAVREIESGNMPKGGLKVDPAELAGFKKWIDDGAKFDGTDPKATLATLVGAKAAAAAVAKQKAPEQPAIPLVAATGKETVSFARDIAPMLVGTCFSCHSAGQNADKGGLRFNHFSNLLKGGESGRIVTPGKPADSLLVKKLKGSAGDRMPLNKKPWSDKEIALVEKWIGEGAKYDGGDPMLATETVAAIAKARDSTHEQLLAERKSTAIDNWKHALPDESPSQVESTNFLVVGSVPETTLKQISDFAEAQATLLKNQFALPADKPLIKGRATLFAVRTKLDYVEWKAVEEREPPINLRGHARHSVIDAYAVLWVPADDKEFSLKTLVSEQVTALLMAEFGNGKLPPWFYSGLGRAYVGRNDARDPRVKMIDESVNGVVGRLASANDLPRGTLGADGTEVASYGFAKYLLKDQGKFNTTLTAIRAGADLDAALTRGFGGGALQLIGAWSGKGMNAQK
jgi:hypothetical protein